MAGAGVVGMGVGDDGTIHCPQRVDIKIARLTKQPGGRGAQPGQQWGTAGAAHARSGPNVFCFFFSKKKFFLLLNIPLEQTMKIT
jgi:hypothetical protein